MTEKVIITSAIALLFLITAVVFAKLYFRQKKKTDQEIKKAITAEKRTENLKERILENEAFQKNNDTDSFNASVNILHDLATRQHNK